MLLSFVSHSLQDKALLTKLATRVKVSFELLQSEYLLAQQLEEIKTKTEKTREDLQQITALTKELIEIQKRIEDEQRKAKAKRNT